MTEYFQTGMKKGRGRAQRSLDMIKAMYEIAEEAQPITGRGVGYKLFSLNLIPSMSRNDMQGVYRLLKEAREEGTIPWEWIVDETRELEQVSTWDNPAAFVRRRGPFLSPRLLATAARTRRSLEREGHGPWRVAARA